MNDMASHEELPVKYILMAWWVIYHHWYQLITSKPEIMCYLYVDSMTPRVLDLGPNSSYHLVSINTCALLKTHYFFIKTTSDNP